MKRFLFIPLCLIALASHAQIEIVKADIDDFYPSLSTVKIKSENLYICKQAAGCVSGDCRNGEGIYLFATSNTRNDFFNLTRYQGKFSNNGALFEGNVSEQSFLYKFSYKGSSLKYEPLEKANLRDENSWKHMLTGSMPRVDAKIAFYKVRGWRPTIEMAEATAGAPRTVKIYFEGFPSYAQIDYAPGGLLKSFSGKIASNGDPICGRFMYSDGSNYEGFVYHGKYFGAGRFTDAKGAVQEGIWKMDTLSRKMAFNFPAAMMEPRPESEQEQKEFHVAEYSYLKNNHRTFLAAGDWAFAYDSTNVMYGEIKNRAFFGTGTWVSFGGNPKSTRITYFAGRLEKGLYKQGFRMIDFHDCNTLPNSWGAFYQCDVNSSSLSEGNYDFNQLNGCGTKIIYNKDGRPVELQEGYFEYAENTIDAPTGWVYINDWAGLRNKEKLQFYYKGRNVKTTNDASDYGYAAYFLQKDQFCFPSMQLQGQATSSFIFHKLDSMNTVYYKNKAITEAEALTKKQQGELEEKERNEKYKACAAELKKYDKPIGSTLTLVSTGFTGILQEVDCEKWLMTIVVPGGRSSMNSARSSTTVSLKELAFWQRSGKQYHLCKKCDGLGGESVTTVTSKTKELPFGYFSGIETRVTHTKTQTSWVSCIYCNGGGVVLE